MLWCFLGASHLFLCINESGHVKWFWNKQVRMRTSIIPASTFYSSAGTTPGAVNSLQSHCKATADDFLVLSSLYCSHSKWSSHNRWLNSAVCILSSRHIKLKLYTIAINALYDQLPASQPTVIYRTPACCFYVGFFSSEAYTLKNENILFCGNRCIDSKW